MASNLVMLTRQKTTGIDHFLSSYLASYPGRTLVGYPGYPRIPQNFRIYSIKFGKNIRKIFFMYCGIPQYQIPNVLPAKNGIWS